MPLGLHVKKYSSGGLLVNIFFSEYACHTRWFSKPILSDMEEGLLKKQEVSVRLYPDLFDQHVIPIMLYTPYRVTTVHLGHHLTEQMTRNVGKTLALLPWLKTFQIYNSYSYYQTPFDLFCVVRYIGTSYGNKICLSFSETHTDLFRLLEFYKECCYFLRKAVEKEAIYFRVENLDKTKKDPFYDERWWYGECMKENIFR